MIEIRYTLTLEDYREANRLWLLNSTFWRKFNFYAFVEFGFLVAATLFLVLVILWILDIRGLLAWLRPMLPLLTGLGAWMGTLGLISPFSYKRKTARWFRDMNLSTERVATINDSGMFVAHADGALESRITWPAFEKYAESENTFVLFLNKRQFVPIPKRAMTEQQQLDFRALLAAHLPRGAAPPTTQAALS